MINLSDFTKKLEQDTENLRRNREQAVQRMDENYQQIMTDCENWKNDISQCLLEKKTSLTADIGKQSQEVKTEIDKQNELIKDELKNFAKAKFSTGMLIGGIFGALFGVVGVGMLGLILWKNSELADLNEEIKTARENLAILNEQTHGIQISTCHLKQKETTIPVHCVELEPRLENTRFGKKAQYRAIKSDLYPPKGN